MAALCRAMEVAPSGYYAWRCRKQSQRRRDDRELLAQIADVFGRSKARYGSPRMVARVCIACCATGGPGAVGSGSPA